MDRAPAVEFGRYRLVAASTYYGAGSLVPARELRTDEPRMLWLLMPHVVNDPATREHAVRVATVLRRLSSPHLVRLHEFGEIEGQPFFAFGAVHGLDLAEASEPAGLGPVEALEVIAQLGTGLDHLHHAGLVDGALGPRRILVTEEGGEKRTLLRHAGLLSVLLSTSALFGTQKQEALDHGAPELHRGEAATVRSDIYSLGSLLWLTLTGQAPFSSYVGHRAAAVPQVAGDGPVEEAVNAVLRKAMAKDPADRYRDMGAFVGTLRSIAALAREVGPEAVPERLVRLDVSVPDSDLDTLGAPDRDLADLDTAPELNGAPALNTAPDVDADPHPDADRDAAPHPGADLGGDADLDPDGGRHAARGLGVAASLPPAPEPIAGDDAEVEGSAADAAGAPGDATTAPYDASAAAPPDVAVEPALRAAMDHWNEGRTVTIRRRRGNGVKGAGVAAVLLGGVVLAAFVGLRQLGAADEAPDNQPPSATRTTASGGAGTATPLGLLFPIAAKGDCVEDPRKVEHRVERWTCDRRGYRVVLTRWDRPSHAVKRMPHGGTSAAREVWTIDGDRAGTQWTWRADGDRFRFRWTAVYDDVPYAVTIEAKNAERRRHARGYVVFRPSTVLG